MYCLATDIQRRMSLVCPDCGKTFSRRDSLIRHIKELHDKIPRGTSTVLPTQELPTMSPNSKECDPLKAPFTMIVSGPTGSGKTVWVQKLLTHRLSTMSPSPQRILWFFAQRQPAYDQMERTIPGITFIPGLPSNLEDDDLFDVNIPNMVVIDDLMSEASNSKQIAHLFTRGSHHRNLSVILLMQNLYYQGRESRTISLNSHYIVLFKNPRDQQQISVLARQMYPRNPHKLLIQYEQATKRPYGYLFIDLKPETEDHCRLRTNILPNEKEAFKIPYTMQLDYSSGKLHGNSLVPPAFVSVLNLEDAMKNTLDRTDLPPYEQLQLFREQQQALASQRSQVRSGIAPQQLQSTNIGSAQQTPISAPPSYHSRLHNVMAQPRAPDQMVYEPTVSTLQNPFLRLADTVQRQRTSVQQQFPDDDNIFDPRQKLFVDEPTETSGHMANSDEGLIPSYLLSKSPQLIDESVGAMELDRPISSPALANTIERIQKKLDTIKARQLAESSTSPNLQASKYKTFDRSPYMLRTITGSGKQKSRIQKTWLTLHDSPQERAKKLKLKKMYKLRARKRLESFLYDD